MKRGVFMNALKANNSNGRLLTYQQMAKNSNLGINTVRKLAKESDSIIRIGKIVRIDPEKFYKHVLTEYSE